jgi:uncharacterized OB-fold protein
MSRESKREELEKKIQAYVGLEIGPPEVAREAVNTAMIRQWCEALDERNPAYTDSKAAESSVHGGIIAPPTMLQAWVLPGMEMAFPSDVPKDKQRELHMIFDSYGYTGVVATNCEQEYVRELHLGDQVNATTVIEEISDQKATGLGTGYFINTRTLFRDQNGDELGWMTFRVLKFIPAERPAAAESSDSGAPAMPTRIPPALGHDNEWWWEGVKQGELLIQRCSDCNTLRHPPRPMCGECQSIEWDSVASRGSGTVNSYVVIHHPPVPGYDYPLVVAVVDLEEGTRFVSNIVDCDPAEVEIGMAVQASVDTFEGDYRWPVFRPA